MIGVVADTLSEGTRSPVLQTVFIHRSDNLQNIVIRIAPARSQEALDYIARTQRSFVHGVALSRTLLSDSYEKLYVGR